MSLEVISDLLDRLKRDISDSEKDFSSKLFKDFHEYHKEYGVLQGKRQALALLQDGLRDPEDEDNTTTEE